MSSKKKEARGVKYSEHFDFSQRRRRVGFRFGAKIRTGLSGNVRVSNGKG